LSTDYFRIFGLEPGFRIDLPEITDKYQHLQKQFHPDRYAGKSQQEVRLAMQTVSLVNQAYETLKSPVARAEYLLQRRGIDTSGRDAINRDTDFLMEQMQLREQLQEIHDATDPCSALDQLARQAREHSAALEDSFGACFTAGRYDQAVGELAKMQFFAKFLREILLREEELDH